MWPSECTFPLGIGGCGGEAFDCSRLHGLGSRVAFSLGSKVIPQHRVVITNKYMEKLVGTLHETGSKGLVILCHGFRSTKDEQIFLNLAATLTREGISTFCFDFSGNGESEGSFQYGNYRKEADDLRCVIQHFLKEQRDIIAIVGHSKGGNAVLLYASMHHDVKVVINISGRFALDQGIEGRLGKDFAQRIEEAGYIDVKNKTGEVEYRVTVESLKDRLSTDMCAASQKINKSCRVLTIHGSVDEVVPVKDAMEFAKLIPNHKLHIVEGANHCYTNHQAELASILLDFIKSNQEKSCDLWCDQLQDLVKATSSCCCGKDEQIRHLQNRVALLEEELRRHKSLLNKTKMIVHSVPSLFSFLKAVDDESGSNGESQGTMSLS